MHAPGSRSECPIHLNARISPEKVAIQAAGEPISYRHLEAMVAHCSACLRNMNLNERTLVGIYSSPSPWYVALLFAFFRENLIAVLLNTRFPLDSIPDILGNIRCSYLIEDSPVVEPLATNELERIAIGDFVTDNLKERIGNVPLIQHDQPATVVFSSGSMGAPRAVLHAWGNHWFSALGSNLNITLNPGDQWLLSLPLYHVAGIAILFRSFIAGSTVMIPDQGSRIEESLIHFEITHASLVATQLRRLVERDQADLRHVKAFLVGGSAVPKSLIHQALKQKLPLFLTYGLSEMASQVTTTPPDAPAHAYNTSGKVLPHRRIMFSTEGELWVRGSTLFLGYLGKNNIQKPFNADGWFQTGDLGNIDEEGWLTVVGRKDNMFISGGENIYPEQIERILELHPSVERSLVVPIQDEEFGMRPVAFIDSGEVQVSKKEIESVLEGVLPRYMYPVAYIPWADAPVRKGIKDSRIEFKQKASMLFGKS